MSRKGDLLIVVMELRGHISIMLYMQSCKTVLLRSDYKHNKYHIYTMEYTNTIWVIHSYYI